VLVALSVVGSRYWSMGEGNNQSLDSQSLDSRPEGKVGRIRIGSRGRGRKSSQEETRKRQTSERASTSPTPTHERATLIPNVNPGARFKKGTETRI
jgi:hypothetical protein